MKAILILHKYPLDAGLGDETQVGSEAIANHYTKQI